MSATPSAEAAARSCRADFPLRDYDLAATLTSGQVFRWQLREGWWEGVIGSRWVRLRAEPDLQIGAGVDGNETALSPLPVERPISDPSQEGDRRASAPRQFPSREAPGVGSASKSAILDRGERASNYRSLRGPSVLSAETAVPVGDWRWLTDYLQLEQDLAPVLASFPEDEPMRAAVAACRGLRLLRQAPWECLASFILSSTKQIVQIQQIVARLCEQFGEQVIVPQNHERAYSFPLACRIAAAAEPDLRACKMGFRAPNLRAAAQMIAGGDLDLDRLSAVSVHEARAALTRLPGVGRKIADCVLLFAYGYQDAFPVDVWVMKALRGLYFPRRSVPLPRLQKFAATHFGPWSGYAQQYLFHYARVHAKLKEKDLGRSNDPKH